MSSGREPLSGELPPEQAANVTFPLLEMTEGEYSHLQHIIQDHPEVPVGTTSKGEDPRQVLPGNTPLSHGLVPSFVLARITDEETSCMTPGSTSNLKKPASAARVCLEKIFNTLSVDGATQPDMQSAAVSSLLSKLQKTGEPQNLILHSEKQKTDTVDVVCVPSSHVMGLYDPGQNVCSQFVALVEPNRHQQCVLPQTFTLDFQPERVVAKTSCSVNVVQEPADTRAGSRCHLVPCCSETAKAAKVDSRSATRAQSNDRKLKRYMSVSQRKERHNSMERERRRKIRLCCDELNLLVPLCTTSTDKLSTLQRAVAFLRYLNESHGDALKEEFVAFSQGRGHFLKSRPSLGVTPTLKGVDGDRVVPLRVEQ